MSQNIITSFGKFIMMIDNKEISYSVTKLEPIEDLCPNIKERYKIEVEYIPNGQKHLLSFGFKPYEWFTINDSGSGENYLYQTFCNHDKSIQINIFIQAETDYYVNKQGQQIRDSLFDYDGYGYSEAKNDIFCMNYELFSITKTSHYIFGLAWITNCNSEELEEQVWRAADIDYM